MRHIAIVLVIVLASIVALSASSFERMDSPVRWSRSVEQVLDTYVDGAEAVTIIPPEEEDGDWTVIFVYADESAPQWI
jgi:hypothetical protein